MLAWFHRWLGVATCLIFAAWFASGAVMLFQPFPSLSGGDRRALEAGIDLAVVRLSPAAALARAGATATALRLVQRGGRPAYVVEGSGATQAIDADTGTRLPPLDRKAAQAEARRLFGTRARLAGPFDYDQWVVHDRFDRFRPFYRLDADEDAGTEAYLSARTGELVQRTTRAGRGWNWVGAVLHWAYVTPLRSSWSAWDRTMWWLSFACLLVALAGTVLGIVRMAAARRLRPPRFSFYRLRWLRWHHLLGLAAAPFVLGWILSGWLSMDHGRMFSRGEATNAEAAAFTGCPLAQALAPMDASAARRAGAASELAFTALACRPLMTIYGAAGTRVLDGRGVPIEPVVLRRLITRAAGAAWPAGAPFRIEPVDPASTYALAEGWPASVLRLVPAGPLVPDLYIDANEGRLLTVMDGSRAAYAWVYYALHTFNVPGLSTRPALRRAVVLVPLAAGFLFSITGVVVGWRRLIRAGRGK